MATWDDVRRLASELPEVEESTSYRRPALKVCGRTFAAMSPHEDGALYVRADAGEQPFLVAAHPNVLYVTPHYEGYGGVLVRLEVADDDLLRELLEEAWLLRAPRQLVDAYAPSPE